MTYSKSDFYKYVAPDVRGVPTPTVEDTAEDVIIDFCQKTSLYRQWLEDQILVLVDDEDVELDLPEDTAIVEVMGIQEVDDSGDYGDFIDPDTYMFSNQGDTLKIIFNDPSDREYDARVRVALRPTIGFTVVPDWIWEDWRDVIAEGIKYRLLSMRSKSWYAPTEAAFHLGLYSQGIRKAARKVVLETVNKVDKPVSRYI
jgi:hypothetical protein